MAIALMTSSCVFMGCGCAGNYVGSAGCVAGVKGGVVAPSCSCIRYRLMGEDMRIGVTVVKTTPLAARAWAILKA
jgi:hypothetical protein